MMKMETPANPENLLTVIKIN